MNILITSGGTKVRIDLVRSITNMSRGTFGSRICDAFWTRIATSISEKYEWKTDKFCEEMEKAEITFFLARDSKRPTAEEKYNEESDSHGICSTKIKYVEYSTFEDYRDGLNRLVKENHYDVIVLAAAVSDYGPRLVFNGKYRSKSEDMTIELVKLPKVIDEIAKIVPNDTVVCGFKLLVNSNDEELRNAMTEQFNHGIDMVVGNDLADIKRDNHRLTIKNRFTDEFKVYEKKDCNLPKVVVDNCFEVYKLKNGRDLA